MAPSAVDLLLSRGANVNTLDARKRIAFHCVLSSSSDRKMLQRDFGLLISNPAASTLVNQAGHTEKTPLHYAFQNQYLWAVDRLLDKGADPMTIDNGGSSLLHLLSRYLASKNDAEPYFGRLLSFGIPIDAKNSKGETPLFIYMTHSTRYMERLPLFTDAGADILTRNNAGQNLLHVIAEKRAVDRRYWGGEEKDLEVEIFNWLMEKGLDATSEDDQRRTRLDLAVAAGNGGILSLFERKN